MYNRKNTRPRIQAKETPTLTGYSCEDFPSRTTQSRLLLRKEEIKPNIWPEIPNIWHEMLKFAKRPECQMQLKVLDISSPTAWVAPDLLKVLVILSDTTVRKYVVDGEDLKPCWISGNSHIFLAGIFLSTFLLPVNSSKESILNWVMKVNLFILFFFLKHPWKNFQSIHSLFLCFDVDLRYLSLVPTYKINLFLEE